MRNQKPTWEQNVANAQLTLRTAEDIIQNKIPGKNLPIVNWQLYQSYRTLGVDDLLANRINNYKQKMYNAALLAMYCFTQYGNSWYTYNSYPYGLVLMSDNKELLKKYAEIDYKPTGRWIKTSYLIEIYKALITENNNAINEGLKIIDNSIAKKKQINLSTANKLCVTGIIEQNKDKFIEGIRIFEMPKQKNRLIRNNVCEEVISINPIIYLRIANIRGFEIEFESERIPKKAIEVSPLSEYKHRFDFLTID